MTQETIVAYDPGLVTGVAEGVFSETEPLRILGGAALSYDEIIEGFGHMLAVNFDHKISEKFVARTDNQFVPDLTPARVEGILDLAYERDIVWRSRTKKEQVPDRILKEHGLWVTGKDVDWTDGRDVNDAIIHMIGYVAFDLRHVPTIREYFQPSYGKVLTR
jgi:hypothetical protein